MAVATERQAMATLAAGRALHLHDVRVVLEPVGLVVDVALLAVRRLVAGEAAPRISLGIVGVVRKPLVAWCVCGRFDLVA